MFNLAILDNAQSRSISPENFKGGKGKGGMAVPLEEDHPSSLLGQGWKVSPKVRIAGGETFEVADIAGPGTIEHIWMTPAGVPWRFLILRIFWDDQELPSVECPLGDFFACGWGGAQRTNDLFAQVSSLAVCVNPGSGLNCYWAMPFRKRCRMTIENLAGEEARLYYQVDYSLGEVPDRAAYFHAQFRRSNPLPYKAVHTVLDGVAGKGRYVGTHMAWGVNNSGWWGEGEIKFFLDGDGEFPTICGTGTEDYFCGSYNFENQREKRYQEFTTPYAGMPQVLRPDGLYASQTRFSLYRWHIPDPIRFHQDLRVDIQALGWRGKKFLPLQDDISSVAFWYQTLPTAPFPALPERDALQII